LIPSVFSSLWRAALTGLGALALAGLTLPASAAIPASERTVLDALYNQTDGANWNDNSGWTGAAGTECDWYGITCDATEDHVTGIKLSYNNLSGTLPDLSALTALQDFRVHDNDLSGPIPELSTLTALRRFHVHRNQLEGQLPVLPPSIIEFHGYVNGLTGPIPALSTLTVLEDFRVHGNDLSGSIPELSALTALRRFHVHSNDLDGQLPTLPASITHFTASNNKLSGPIPDLSASPSLTTFWVDENQLSGAPAAVPPTSLTNARVCPNYLELSGDPAINTAWETATGNTPWNEGCTRAPAPAAIPTLSAWTLALLSLLLGGIAIWRRPNAG